MQRNDHLWAPLFLYHSPPPNLGAYMRLTPVKWTLGFSVHLPPLIATFATLKVIEMFADKGRSNP